MTKQDFFLKATAMLAQAIVNVSKADEPMEFDVYDIANRATEAASKLITAAEIKWATIDNETPLFDVPDADPEDVENTEGDTTNDGEGGSDNDGEEGNDTEGNNTEGGATDGEDNAEGQ